MRASPTARAAKANKQTTAIRRCERMMLSSEGGAMGKIYSPLAAEVKARG